MTHPAPSIVWFRSDLRLADNPALTRAVEAGRPIIPVFILDDEAPGRYRPGGATRWWLHYSLRALADSLAGKGARLILRRGPAETELPRLVKETGAGAIFWNRLYEPWANERDARIKTELRQRGCEVESFNARLLAEPWVPKTGGGEPYRVFTPFWKALVALGEPEPPLPAPPRIEAGPAVAGDELEDWALTPSAPDWAGGLRESWTPGETGALGRLDAFLDGDIATYKDARNRPDKPATSRLSPHLRWGEVSPRQIWHAVRHRIEAAGGGAESSAWSFLRELGWREFSYHLLYWWPDLPERTWKEQFLDFPWAEDEAGYRAWTKGQTGYPMVDAGIRELWHTGWMHNRARMIAASFLVKDLLIPWQKGERWFWDTLVDADLANNAASWQWVAGCGADAAPYFRIFNPLTQGRKFDPNGDYVRRWIPELARLPDAHIHAPWAAPQQTLDAAGVRLGETYPVPIVDHQAARKRALEAFERIKKQAA
ncbi:cryptochrome/photolyase family protein [Ferruginivarius sediminum]|uniref:Deoxyribodipyrimidine photo-lyase n=1 Tax=Ferruginivarius sediminum TaxID=2661937 RepID=A0A369T9M0_9PROT|nr:deoxyribodipyrimidine photo-lyase [Ferruginivarius sediminum]RDD60867.1 deoxyribodipyrimidine photo-lyase [Ferruginivarius sediminum]